MEKNVKVFLDSNVILSGLISEKGPPRIILDIFSLKLPILIGVTGQYNIIEIERNLIKKAPDVLTIYKKYFSKLNLQIIPFPSQQEIQKYMGKISDKDVPVLVSAIKENVDFLITGDKKHFDKLKVEKKYPFQIINPAEFINYILPEFLTDVIRYKDSTPKRSI